jgi:hypothetical protein
LQIFYADPEPHQHGAALQQWLRISSSVAELHHFYAAPALGKYFDATPAAPAPTLLFSKAKFLKFNAPKFNYMLKQSFSFDSVRFILLKI